MSDLHDRLHSALATVEPGHAPVDAAMRAGTTIRRRRRAGLVTATVGVAAVVAAAVVGVPALAHRAAPAPATSHLRVTVNPPGPHAAPGLIASGLIGRSRWNLSVASPKTKNCMFSGAGVSWYSCNGSIAPATAAQPINFEGMGGTAGSTPDDVSFGVVWAGLASARVTLSDGTVLTLRPTEIDGLRFVAFAAPSSLTVASVTAYEADGGEIATAIPYQPPGGLPNFGSWQKPGQPLPARLNGTFPVAAATAQPSQVGAHLGPWGTCLYVGGDGYCYIPPWSPATGPFGFAGTYVVGTAANSVSYLIVTPKDGAAIRVPAVTVGQQKFWAVAVARPAQSTAHWTAYNAAGHPVASGTLT